MAQFPFWHMGGGAGREEEKGLQTLLEGWEEASRPVHSPAAGACLRRADTTEAWMGPGPRKQLPDE